MRYAQRTQDFAHGTVSDFWAGMPANRRCVSPFTAQAQIAYFSYLCAVKRRDKRDDRRAERAGRAELLRE